MTFEAAGDREAIKDLRYAYSMRYDAHELDALVELFAEDAVCHFLPEYGGDWVGRDAIRRNFSQWIGTGEAFDMLHVLTNPLIEFTGPDSAKGRWLVHAYLTRQGDDPLLQTRGGHDSPLFLIGLYEDRYRKVGGAWKFASTRLSTLWPTRDFSGLLPG
jgi:hypothetical protein